jgi:hypothetical protein
MIFANRISSSTSCSIWPPETSPPSSARGLLRHRFQSCNTSDWTIRENVRAKLRVAVKRTLRKYGYPPDKQEKAPQTVIEQAELILADAA